MDALEIKRTIARYLRYEMQCPIIALELNPRLTASNDGGLADLLAVDKTGHIVEVEVKVSLADFKADRRKEKHEAFRKYAELPYKGRKVRYFTAKERILEPRVYFTNRFYFAVPHDLGNEVKLYCDRAYPYAGVFTIGEYFYGNVSVHRQPKKLYPNKISLLEATRLAKGQSATIVRLLDELAITKKGK